MSGKEATEKKSL